MTTHADIIIIGAGPGGYPAAGRAASRGKSVIIVESGHVGGTCLNCGCIPTKTLCHNAQIIDTLKRHDELGLAGLSYTLDFPQIMRRKDEVVGQLRSGVETMLSAPGITLVRGHATLTGPRAVAVDGTSYTAENIIIATGSRPATPPIEGTTLPGVVTSTQLLEIAQPPKRLCIIGAGVVGLEMASAFSSFGSEVTVAEFLKEALPGLDSDIAKRLRQTIAKRGVTFNMRSAVKSICQNPDGSLSVNYENKRGAASAVADMALVATGRKPNTDGLGLESAGVEITKRGITVDENFQTTAPGIYAIGDVNGTRMLAHAATFQGTRAVNHILGVPDKIRQDIMPFAVFTNPEAAGVGLSEDDCRAKGLEYKCRKAFYRACGKALAIGQTDGMLKLLSAPDGAIIGCHAFGPHASDMAQEVTALMNAGATVADLAHTIHIHPTLSEILHSAAQE